MIGEFSGLYKGFKEKGFVGEVFEIENELWVIIRIVKMNLVISYTPIINIDFIAQKVNSTKEYGDFTNNRTITNKINLGKMKRGKVKIREIGEVINIEDSKSGAEAIAIVESIESFEYEHTDIIITYKIEHIIPWSQEKIDKIAKKERLSTFKVIQGKRGL